MKTILAVAFFATCIASPALADYYIVKDVETQKCMIDSDRPSDTSRRLLAGPYETYVDALLSLQRVCDRRG